MYCIEAPSNYRDDEQVDFLPVTEAGGGEEAKRPRFENRQNDYFSASLTPYNILNRLFFGVNRHFA